MNIDYQAEVRENHVYIHCQGIYNERDLMLLFDEVLQIPGRNDREVVLVDVREISGDHPTTMERYKLGVFISEHNYLGICIVVVGKEPYVDPGRFGETVALNRGARGKVFIDMEAALAWIDSYIQK